MIVTCPQCSKRYMLDDELLPKQGRQVRCISCQHIWHQIPAHFPPAKLFFPIERESSRPIPKKRVAWVGWSVCFMIVLSFFSFLVFGRDVVVDLFPRTERAYKLAGLPLKSRGTGLVVENTKILLDQTNPKVLLVVSGDLTNSSGRVKPIPPLKLKLIGDASHSKCLQNTSKKACVVEQWDHRLSESFLLPGETIHFETIPRPKVEGVHHILVEF